MFACNNLSVKTPDGTPILREAKANFKPQALNAIIGPSGCGKTTLVKAMLGIIPATGEVTYGGQPISASEDLSGRVGFAPQFSIAQPKLTVAEAIGYTLALFVTGKEEQTRRLESILETIGLSEHREKRVEALSGGQLRRLGLGLELTLDPACLVCDEVTSGLDPNSEDQILTLLDTLRQDHGKTFLCIIHNLAKLHYFECITVVNSGEVVFQGNLDGLCQHFDIPDALHLYDRLNELGHEHWKAKWEDASKGTGITEDEVAAESTPAQPVTFPSALSQFATLFRRRMVLFLRDKGYLGLTVAITLGFPCLVVIFAWDGLPQIQSLALDRSLGIVEELQQTIAYKVDQIATAQLVTGLIMFQVILLTLMGANNGAREIAAERTQFEKERFSGLNFSAYALSKVVFVLMIAFIQGAWMTFFVKSICEFPGPWLWEIAALCFVCGAMTLVSLGFSAIFKSAEKASLLSIYLVGFQLPLSGVVLALPDALVWVCRPFITCYWGWAGYLTSMRDTRLFDAFRQQNTDWVASPAIALLVLGIQGLVGLAMIWWGCSRKQWHS